MRGASGQPGSRASLATSVLIGGVRVYQKTLAHVLGGQCRFQPTCSVYAIEALRIHGALRGTWLTLRRIGRCHPWGGAGWDPPPPLRGGGESRE